MTNTPPPPPGSDPGQPPQPPAPQQPIDAGSVPPPTPWQPQPAPSGAMPGYTPPAAVEKPASVALAQKLMYAGAVLVIVDLIVSYLTIGQLRDQIAETPGMSADDIDLAVTIGLIFGTVVGLVYVGLWLWMAWANGNGRNWARITASVFFGISVLGLIYILVTGLPIAKVIEVISFLVGAATIYLLWAGKGAKEYFASRS